MTTSVINSDDGLVSGSAGLKTTGGNDGVLQLQSNGTATVTVDASGQVGIGTASPSVPLAVYKASDSAINIQNSTSGVTNVDGLQLLLSGANGYMWNYENGANIFGTNNTERMRIDSSGNVGIGTSSPAYKLDTRTTVAATTTVQDVAYFVAESSGTTTSGFGARLLLGTENANGNIWPAGIAALNSSAGSNLSELGFYTATSGPTLTERARITSDGYLRMASGSGGIQFNGDTAAANALDDYEEGTFTPNIIGDTSGEATYTNRAGTYTKIGRQVTVNIVVGIASKGTMAGSLAINSLPFTVGDTLSHTSLESTGNISFFSNLSSAVSSLSIASISGTTNANFYRIIGTSDTNCLQLAVSEVGSTFDFRATITYFTA